MKNIALIKSIVATSISSANPAELTEHIAALIQAHPEETRENALAILTGTAELTVRPVDQVELTCNSSNYTNLSFMGEPTVNLLEGTVCCSVNYTRTETRWYKTEEDANAGRNGSYNHDDYVIARDMWAGVIKKGLWALSLIAFCYGWQNSTCCRWNSFNRSYFSQHCKSFIDCYYSAQCNYWDVHCRTRS